MASLSRQRRTKIYLKGLPASDFVRGLFEEELF